MILFLDTTTAEIKIILFTNSLEKSKELSWQSRANQSEELLQNIQELLENEKIKISDLSAVAIKTGPGSYTGLRVGITIVNLLGFSLNIPVIGVLDQNDLADKKADFEAKGFSAFTLPYYEREPHITKEKKWTA